MTSHKQRKVVMIVLACLAICLAAGCTEEKVAAPEDEEYVNPDKPNANSLILAQNTFGDSGSGSTIWSWKTDGVGGYYFIGKKNSRYGVGQVSATGDLAWFTRTNYEPRNICALSASAKVPNGLLVVGAYDNDSDGEIDVGYVSLFGSSGSLLSQVLCASDTSNCLLNSIASISDSTFLVVGAEQTPSRKEPLVATIVLTSAGQIEKSHQAVINTIEDSFFGSVVMNPTELLDPELSFYVLSGRKSDANIRSLEVHKVSAALPTLSPWTVDWTKEIVVTPGMSMQTSTGSMRLFQGHLYCVGYTDDPDKEPAPSDSTYWKSGVAASLSLTGELRWLIPVPLTQHSDMFYGCVPTQEGLYTVGVAARFYRSDQYFGYGWISKIALDTGDVVSNMTFGLDSGRSGFNDAVVSGSGICCGGWTRRQDSGSGYLGWFCEIDISNPPSVECNKLLAPARVGDSEGEEGGMPSGF